MSGPRVAVVGAGAWGTTLALMIGRVEPVVLLAHDAAAASRIAAARENERRLPGIALPDSVVVSADPHSVADASDLVIFAVPSNHLRVTAERIAPHVPASADVLSVAKGLERGTLLRMTQVIVEAAAVSPRRVAALSGPNLASEIARGLPASAVVAAEMPELADRIVDRLGRREFRLYINSDMLGVELCGALKNVIAIAAGAADGLGFGDNGKAGLMTRGLAEMTTSGSPRGPIRSPSPGWRGSAMSSRRAARRCRATTASGWSWRRAAAGTTSRPPCPASPRAPTPSMRRSPSPAATGSRCRSPRKSTTRYSRARASSVA